jgi:hypothetical protein
VYLAMALLDEVVQKHASNVISGMHIGHFQ